MVRPPSPSAGTVSAASSRALSALRASPSALRARCSRAGPVIRRPPPPRPRSPSSRARAQQDRQIALLQGLELEDLRAGHQGGVDEEEGVVGGGPDQADHAALHIGKEHVLLGLVEAVDLVDEQQGGLSQAGSPLGGRAERPAHLGHVRLHAAEPLEPRPGGSRDDPGQGGLPRAGRPVEDQRLDPVRLDGPAQEPARPQQVALPQELVEGAGAHAGRQRGAPPPFLVKQKLAGHPLPPPGKDPACAARD